MRPSSSQWSRLFCASSHSRCRSTKTTTLECTTLHTSGMLIVYKCFRYGHALHTSGISAMPRSRVACDVL